MRLIILISLFSLAFASSVGTPSEGCQFCVDGVMKVFNAAVTDEGIADEINLLELLCVDYEDFEGCHTGIATWWPMIARKIFVEVGAEHTCKAIDPTCDFSLVKAWDCEACKKDVFAVAQVLTSDAAAADLVNDLSGPYFCQSGELALDESQVEQCQTFVAGFMPEALKLLFELPSEDAAAYTCKMYFDLCQ